MARPNNAPMGAWFKKMNKDWLIRLLVDEIKKNSKLEEEINNIFVRFIYFSQYFYVEFGNEMWGDEDGINDTLNMKYEKIFEKISDNIFSGMFLFSEFDLYDKYVLDVLNQPIISKYTNEQEVAMLFQFVMGKQLPP